MVRTLMSAPPTERVGRHPSHSWNVKYMPFVLQPVFMAPVLPGETLETIYTEARCVSDPLLNPIIGHKKEYHFFYVRITDLLVDAIRDMFVDPTNTDLGPTYGIAANSTPYYTAKGGIDYMKRCTEKVVQHWFRDQDETMATAVTADGLPIVQIKQQSWMDSLIDSDNFAMGPDLDAATTAQDFDAMLDAFNQLRALGIANMTYEDFLRSYGIAIPNKDEAKPEKLWSFTEFSYPSNTINPTNGVPASAMSWAPKETFRGRKFFKEPGFIIGYTVVRPKVYFSGLAGQLAAHMTRAWDWMPNYLTGMPETQLKHFAADTGPLGDRTTATDDHWVDMRDLLLYGDQFQNHTAFAAVPALAGANHMLPLPDGAAHTWKYPTEAMCKAFFVDAAGTAFNYREDGFASLGIKGTQVDYTVGNFAEV